MNINALPSRHDSESMIEMIHSLGWKTKVSGTHVEVRPAPDAPVVQVSAISYKFCGIWLRPVYSKVTIETFIDLDTIAAVLLLGSFNEIGAVSVVEMNKETMTITFTCRLMIPSEPSERAYLAEGILSASYSGADLQQAIRRIHEQAAQRTE